MPQTLKCTWCYTPGTFTHPQNCCLQLLISLLCTHTLTGFCQTVPPQDLKVPEVFQGHLSYLFSTVKFSFFPFSSFCFDFLRKLVLSCLTYPCIHQISSPPFLITSWHVGQVQSPLKDVHTVCKLIKFLEVSVLWLPGRWGRDLWWGLCWGRVKQSSALWQQWGVCPSVHTLQTDSQHGGAAGQAVPEQLQHSQFLVQGGTFPTDGKWEELWTNFRWKQKGTHLKEALVLLCGSQNN